MRLTHERHPGLAIYRADIGGATIGAAVWTNCLFRPMAWTFDIGRGPGWLALSAGPLRLTLRRH